MLLELAVRNLGVIEEASVVLPSGLIALTGETGAGKTLVTEALALLAGGRADPTLVRPGATEAEVEGRFVLSGPGTGESSDAPVEVTIRRVIPADGRSRAYVDGRLATAAAVAETVGDQLDLHGQHGQQSLLRGPARRAALDAYGSIDAAPLAELRHELRTVQAELDALGGDERSRAREIELLRFQLDELEAASIDSPDEDDLLKSESLVLGDASAHRESAIAASSLLGADGVVGDGLARALALITDRAPFSAAVERLTATSAEISDLASELRSSAESITDDPARLAAVGERRQVLAELRRKYGATLAEVMEYRDEIATRCEALEGHDSQLAALEEQVAALQTKVTAEEKRLGSKRRKAAPGLSAEVERGLHELALPSARIEVAVGADPGDDVEFLVSMNPGAPTLPLSKVASGGELSRVMLSLQLVLADAPPTLVFDEVDAGVGGEAASAIGRALAGVASGRQVLVVTHLAQVAAFADHHIQITKDSSGDSTRTTLSALPDSERVIELSRMLSGSPDSQKAKSHAAELLGLANRDRPS